MPTPFPDTEGFAFSFSHASLKLDGQLFSAIESISWDQTLEEAATFGTSNKPLRRSAGRLGLGTGTVVFSDLESGMKVYDQLGDKPLTKLFSIDYVLTREDGLTRSYEFLGCRLTGFSGDHSQGADALQLTQSFSFLSAKVNGKELV